MLTLYCHMTCMDRHMGALYVGKCAPTYLLECTAPLRTHEMA